MPLIFFSTSTTLTERVFFMLGSDFSHRIPWPVLSSRPPGPNCSPWHCGYLPAMSLGFPTTLLPIFLPPVSSLLLLSGCLPIPRGVSSRDLIWITVFSTARLLFLSPSCLCSWSHLTSTCGPHSVTDVRTSPDPGWKVFKQCQLTTLWHNTTTFAARPPDL